MQGRPRFGISVRDLEMSLRFYRDQVGLAVESDVTFPDTAILTTPQNLRFVIAGPNAPELEQLLGHDSTILRPGEKIFLIEPEFEQRLRTMANNGADYRLIERAWGDRGIEAVCPDGYGVAIWEKQNRTRQEILDLVRLAQDGLRAAIEGLSDEELSWRPDTESWSVREVVHHIADANLTVLHVARAALADPGREYHSNPYDQNHYASELRYQVRPIEPSLRLYESTLDVLLAMVDAVPGAWDRSVRTSGGGETSVESYLLMLATHSLEHLEQINEIRAAMGRDAVEIA